MEISLFCIKFLVSLFTNFLKSLDGRRDWETGEALVFVTEYAYNYRRFIGWWWQVVFYNCQTRKFSYSIFQFKIEWWSTLGHLSILGFGNCILPLFSVASDFDDNYKEDFVVALEMLGVVSRILLSKSQGEMTMWVLVHFKNIGSHLLWNEIYKCIEFNKQRMDLYVSSSEHWI